MDGWIELGVWAALVGTGAWLAWPRVTEPRWVRILERGLPVRGRWARRLTAVPVLVLSLFPFAHTYTPLVSHSVIVVAGHCDYRNCLGGCMEQWPRAPQGISYTRNRQWSGVHAWTLRIGYWEARVVWIADADRG